MRTEDVARHRMLMEQTDDRCRAAGEAIRARDALTWPRVTEAALAAARGSSPIETLHFDEALCEALASIVVPLPGGAVRGVRAESQTSPRWLAPIVARERDHHGT